MTDITPNLALPYIIAAQAQKHVTHNEAIRALDAIVQIAVVDRDLTSPPPSPSDGDRYIVAAGAVDAWAGRDGAIAAFQDNAWIFYTPRQGWLVWVSDENVLTGFDGSDWVAVSSGGAGVNPADLVGVNTTADPINRLAVKSDAVLLSHDDVTPGNGGVQVKANKAAVSDTASLLFQTGFSGRAEIGLTGDDNLHVKVSPDGSTWHQAMTVQASTGSFCLPPQPVAALPPASVSGAGCVAFVSDDEGGPVLAFSDGADWRRTTDRAVVTDARFPLIVLTGESNAGGLGSHADATAAELAPRADVRILNNTTLAFEDLDVETNNLIGHTGLTDNATHGLELALANTAAAGRWPKGTLYVVKTGQGGSLISEWASGHASGYWSTFASRVSAAQTELANAGVLTRPVVFYSQGINDTTAGTPVVTWKAETNAHLAAIRAALGADTLIVMTRLMSPTHDAINVAIDEIAAGDAHTIVLDTTGAPLADPSHWDYAGLKLIAERFVDAAAASAGSLPAPTLMPNGGTFSSAQTVTLDGPLGAAIHYTLDGSAPDSGSPVYAAPLVVTSTTTINAIAIRQGYSNSDAAAATFEISAPGYVDWTDTQNASDSGDYLLKSGTPAGGRAVTVIDATQPFAVVADLDDAARIEGVVVYLDDVATADYAWQSGLVFVAGLFGFGGTLYRAIGGYGADASGSYTVPALVRMRKSGNDLVFEVSSDGGTSYAVQHTEAGVLAGKTTLYLKALFAAGGDRIRVRVE